MNSDIMVIVERLRDSVAPISYELLGRAAALREQCEGRVIALVAGYGIQDVSATLSPADVVISIENEALAEFTPEAWQSVLYQVLDQRRPGLLLLGATSVGIDLAAALSEQLDVPMVSNCTDIRVEDGMPVFTSQMYGGKILVESSSDAETVIAQVMPGTHAPAPPSEALPVVEGIVLSAEPEDFRSRFVSYITPDEGDIDITQFSVLVSVGRGIQSQDNIGLAEELARALGGAVSSSRPVVDQDWLPITRQVGKSGMIVSPKLYLALGISGAPEHLEGMKDAELIVAVNSDPKAPIFSVAHYGIEADVLDFIPELTEKLHEPAV